MLFPHLNGHLLVLRLLVPGAERQEPPAALPRLGPRVHELHQDALRFHLFSKCSEFLAKKFILAHSIFDHFWTMLLQSQIVGILPQFLSCKAKLLHPSFQDKNSNISSNSRYISLWFHTHNHFRHGIWSILYLSLPAKWSGPSAILADRFHEQSTENHNCYH